MMNQSKRTWILVALAMMLIIAAILAVVLSPIDNHTPTMVVAYDEPTSPPTTPTLTPAATSVPPMPATNTPAPTETPDDPADEESILEYIGQFIVTAYCPCDLCCGKWSNPDNPKTASGAPAVEGITVGADWNTLPKGTVIEIDGVGRRIVQDKPAKWIVDKYERRILDLYFLHHKDTENFKKELDVWIALAGTGE